MHTHRAILDLAAIAIVLACCTNGVLAAFVSPRLINQANRIRMSVVAGNDLLATIAKLFFIPLDRFQKAL